ncbi:MAG: uroporphyrinogen-III synthase [Pseudomonadota bacterium]|nr:uroporphyrinogen-III synthase [Pseudomonadota bacterium]
MNAGVLVTRPLQDAAPLATLLESRGLKVFINTLLEIRFFPDPLIDVRGVQAVVVTSANGVRALARLQDFPRSLPLYGTGDATAAEATRAGFVEVYSAQGDVQALAVLIRTSCRPDAGDLLHAAGVHTAGDLAAMLAPDGFVVRKATLYEAVPVQHLLPETVDAFRQGQIGCALFMSVRTAQAFVDCAIRDGIAEYCASAEALCLSPAVAAALDGLSWKAVRAAERPTLEDLLAIISHTLSSPPPPCGGPDPRIKRG